MSGTLQLVLHPFSLKLPSLSGGSPISYVYLGVHGFSFFPGRLSERARRHYKGVEYWGSRQGWRRQGQPTHFTHKNEVQRREATLSRSPSSVLLESRFPASQASILSSSPNPPLLSPWNMHSSDLHLFQAVSITEGLPSALGTSHQWTIFLTQICLIR